jgi:hypothetical protein
MSDGDMTNFAFIPFCPILLSFWLIPPNSLPNAIIQISTVTGMLDGVNYWHGIVSKVNGGGAILVQLQRSVVVRS